MCRKQIKISALGALYNYKPSDKGCLYMKKIIRVALMVALTLPLGSCLNLGDPMLGVTDLISEDMWEAFFPERWGVGEHWHTTYQWRPVYNEPNAQIDLYSYENFALAVNLLKTIQLKIVPGSSGGRNSVYKKDSRYDNNWVYLCEGAWTQSYSEEKIIDFSHFCNKPDASMIDRTRELAAFLANISHESGESDAAETYIYGLFYREETSYEWGYTEPGYVSTENTDYPAVSGQSYHGRGPIQISWNYNYGQLSLLFLNDKNTLLSNPDKLMEEGKLAFMSAIWYWMYPQDNKPSCHDVIYPDYEPANYYEKDEWGFGHTVIIINGGIEGNGQMKTRRLTFYKDFADKLNIEIGINGEKLNTDGMSGYG